VVCRLHAVLGELIPGGVPKVITAARATRVLRAIRPEGAVQTARCELAAALLDDLRGTDTRIGETRKMLAVTVTAAGTSLTGLFGVGPVIAAAVLGDVRDVGRFPGCPGGGTGGSTTPSTWPRSPRSATGTAGAAPATTRNWPRARPPKRPCAP
jgi:hypothetical protein